MVKQWIRYVETAKNPHVIQGEWTAAPQPITAAPPVAPLTRPTLLSWLYTMPATRQDTTLAADLDVGLVQILVAHTLQHPVAWVDPLAQVGRFVQTAYAPIESPDPDLIVALMPGAEAFQAALRSFQETRMKPHRGNWGKWYQTMMAAARDLVAPLQALRPTAEEALFVLRWAALVAAGGRQNSVVE